MKSNFFANFIYFKLVILVCIGKKNLGFFVYLGIFIYVCSLEVLKCTYIILACLEAFLETEDVPKFYSTAAKQETFAKKTMRMKTFPDFLVIQLLKFAVDDSWVPYKLDIEVGMPDHLDLTKLTGSGLQPGEEILPDDDIPKKEVNIFFQISKIV